MKAKKIRYTRKVLLKVRAIVKEETKKSYSASEAWLSELNSKPVMGLSDNDGW